MHSEWQETKLDSAFRKLSSGRNGLSSKEAAERLKKHGPNEIQKTRKVSPLKIFLSQFTSPLILILIGAALVSLAIELLPGEESNMADSILIIIIVIAVGVSGFFQDWKAEKAIEALRRMSTPIATVMRDGKEVQIPSTQIVPGDIVLVEAGDVIPADGKITESLNMMLDESILTGESKSVRKSAGSMLSMNTSLISGRGRFLAVATGMETEVGKVAAKMQEIEEVRTPFQKELETFSKKMFWLVIAIAAIVMTAGYFKYGLYTAFLTSVSLAVAAIPEGLPAVVTLALALGAKSMVSNNALIRKLPVVESVGSINVICTDKTGTLTKNLMSVTKVFFDDVVYDSRSMKKGIAEKMRTMLLTGALCSNTKTVVVEGKKKIIGDQTEVAIRRFSEDNGISYEDANEKYRRVNEVPFTSKRKMMSVLCRHDGKHHVFTKGAPEVVLRQCDRIYTGGRITKLDAKMRKKILKQNSEFASRALRVLAFAWKESGSSLKENEIEKDLVFLGLEGMLDPPRDEVRDALAECKTAGIRVVMITGDNAETARAIADDIGLESNGTLSGEELEKIDDNELSRRLNGGLNIFARTTPFDKLRILKNLQKGNRVAMTGDGVNDSLALKKADVGISMGERGTEVAKEASDIILLDDNFTTIKNAVREGRRIFDNIRKFVNYLLSCNLAEVFVIFGGTILLTLHKPILLPVHILWINLLTDGMPALALGLDPALPDIMKRQPRSEKDGILDRKTLYNVIFMGINLSVLLGAVFLLLLPMGIETARTALFTGFVIYEFMRIAIIRHNEELGFFQNRMLVMTLGISIILQLAVLYTPVNSLLSLVPLGLYEWAVLLSIGTAGWFSSIGISKLLAKM
ncbi:MAG: calcium-translocating P-type ATPase, PMCA-type [Candidatus Aenigmarchaeota archaeon]|nr:calcium-translocating P-type ATPase, PMCA-type [Candidatus Aenigmarchaeota archaeon]